MIPSPLKAIATLFLFSSVFLTGICAYETLDGLSRIGSSDHAERDLPNSVPQITLSLKQPGPVSTHTSTPTWQPSTRKECIVTPLGWGRDDAEQILEAVRICGQDGSITLPAPFVYTISTRLYMRLSNARLNVHGILSFMPDLGYWTDNSHRVEFQNQSTAWIIEGNNFIVDGGGWRQGGILGNGQAWYTRAQGHSNLFGRPISLSVYNSTNVTITNFSVYQPQFWSFWIQDSTFVNLTNIYINGTNTDPAGNNSNYATNIDGIDTMRVNHLTLQNWLFHGGDDCFAPKGNSTNMTLKNMTCIGGGIAFGSVGQYPKSPDYITNITATDIHVAQDISPLYGGANVSGGAYFKSWVGVEKGVPPQGGGSGTGRVSNITFNNLAVKGLSQAVYINKCYYKVPEQANYCDTSTLEFEQLSFNNVTGTVNSHVGINLNCSLAAPCQDLAFAEINLSSSATGSMLDVKCVNAENVTGVQCT